MEQAPEDPAEGFGKKEVDRVPAKSPIENIPLDQTSDPIRSKPKKLVLILREDNVGDLANSLQMFAPKGSSVTVVSKEKPEVSLTAAQAPSLLLPCPQDRHLQGKLMHNLQFSDPLGKTMTVISQNWLRQTGSCSICLLMLYRCALFGVSKAEQQLSYSSQLQACLSIRKKVQMEYTKTLAITVIRCMLKQESAAQMHLPPPDA